MRNLKRVLSLAMAAAMLIGMMVVSAGAVSTYEDFTDKDEIQNTEAVNTMVSLGVINGKDDGSYFDPSGIVTRAEMAALIARCLNGGIDPSLGTGASTTQFTDTKGHWAEAYIAYCANLGIINGKGDGTFGPDETVTGTAAAKMFLCALGYRSEIEGLTGTGWDLNTDTLANKVGLYDGLTTIRPSDGLNRDNTAQLIYNGVQASEVEYQNNYGEYSGVIYAQAKGTMLTRRFRVVKVTGVLLANDKMSVDAGGDFALEGESLLNVRDVSGYNSTDYPNLYGKQNYKIATSDEMVGQEIVIYVKFLNNLSPNAASSTVIGTAILTSNNTVVETNGRLKNPDAVRSAIRAGGLTSISGTAAAYLFTEQDRAAGVATGITDNATLNAHNAVDSARSAGVLQRFIDNNGNGTADVIIQIRPTLAKVAAVNSSKETYTFSAPIGSQDFVDVVTDGDLEKDDYVLITKYSDGRYYVEPATVVEGEVTAYGSGSKQVTIDGTNYANAAGDNLTGLEWQLSSELVGGTYALYLDKYNNVLAFEEVSAAIGNYAVVQGVSASGSESMGYSARVKVLMQDGTTGTYDLNTADTAVKLGLAKDSDSGRVKENALFTSNPNYYINPVAQTQAGLIDHLFSYTLNDNEITLSLPQNVNARYQKVEDVSATFSFKNTVANITTDDHGNILADGNTVFFFKNKDNSYSVVTGLSSLPSGGVAQGTTDPGDSTNVREAIYYRANGSSTQAARAVFASLNGTYSSSNSYAYVSGDYSVTRTDGSTVYSYPVVLPDGTASTLLSRTETANASIKNQVREYSTGSNGYVTFKAAGPNDPQKAIVDHLGNGSIGLIDATSGADMGSFVLASNCPVWNVEDTANIYDAKTLAVGDVISAIQSNNPGELKAVFVYDNVVSGQADETTAVELTVGGGTLPAGPTTLKTSSRVNVGQAGGYVVADTTTLTVTATAPAGTSAAVTINDSSATGYTVTSGDLAAGYVTVRVTLTKADNFARVESYTVYLTEAPNTEHALTVPAGISTVKVNGEDKAVTANAVNVMGGAEVVITGLTQGDAYTIDDGAHKTIIGADGKLTFDMPNEVTTLKRMVKLTFDKDSAANNYDPETVYAVSGDTNVQMKITVTKASTSPAHDRLTFDAGVGVAVGGNLIKVDGENDGDPISVIVDKALAAAPDGDGVEQNVITLTIPTVTATDAPASVMEITPTVAKVFKVEATEDVTVTGITNTNNATATAAVPEDTYVKANETVTVTVTVKTAVLTGSANGYTATVSKTDSGTTLTQVPANDAVAITAGAAVDSTHDIEVTITAITADETLTVALGDKS